VTLETPSGVEAFNQWTIWVMARLWDNFPNPQHFNCSPVAVTVTGDPGLAGEQFGPDGAEQVPLFRHTMNWLIAEGFLRGKANGFGTYAGISLTSMGFSVLNEVPRAVAEKSEPAAAKTLGVLMREAVVSQTVAIAGGLIQVMLHPSSHS
jgi:hypothetical protein